MMPRLVAAGLAMMAALAACVDGAGTTGPSQGTAFGGGGATANHDERLVGTWSRTVVITTANDAQSSQTIWDFRADGGATRTVVTLDALIGVADTVSTTATWRTSGSSVIITYVAPSSGTVTFAYTVTDTMLTLGTDQFTRVA